MSRSKRNKPILGIATAETEAPEKAKSHRRGSTLASRAGVGVHFMQHATS